MELKDFIAGTIKQVTDGILEGDKYVKEKANTSEGVRSQYTTVKFDVGVSVNEEHKDEYGGKVSVVQVLNIGGSKSKLSNSTSENRIQFEILINVKTS